MPIINERIGLGFEEVLLPKHRNEVVRFEQNFNKKLFEGCKILQCQSLNYSATPE